MLACVPWEYALPNKSWIESEPVKTQRVWNMKKKHNTTTSLDIGNQTFHLCMLIVIADDCAL